MSALPPQTLTQTHPCSHGLEMRAVVTAAHEVSAALEGDLASAMELVDAGCVSIGLYNTLFHLICKSDLALRS